MYSGHVDQTAFGTMGHFGMSYFKWIVICDDDIDINDPFMRDWVMAWRVRPDKDIKTIPHTASVELDPSSFEPGLTQADISGSKMVIDATKKWDYPAVSLPPLGKMRKVADNWGDYGLPELDELKLPREE